MVRGENPFERQCWIYESTSCGEMAEGGFSVHEKKSARSLMVCFLALECGYWQVSQFENWVSSFAWCLLRMVFQEGIIRR
jgi:hypothetical protein